MPRNHCVAALGAALLITVAAGCSSDDASSDSSAPGATTVATDVTTTSTSTGAGADASTPAGGSDTVEDRSVIVNFLLSSAASNGVSVDSKCVLDLVAQLADEDAHVLAESFRTGTPPAEGDLSDEGEALGDQLPSCEATPTS